MGELGIVVGAGRYSGATREEVATRYLDQNHLPINAENIRRFVSYAWPSQDQGLAGPRREPPRELFAAASPRAGSRSSFMASTSAPAAWTR